MFPNPTRQQVSDMRLRGRQDQARMRGTLSQPGGPNPYLTKRLGAMQAIQSRKANQQNMFRQQQQQQNMFRQQQQRNMPLMQLIAMFRQQQQRNMPLMQLIGMQPRMMMWGQW